MKKELLFLLKVLFISVVVVLVSPVKAWADTVCLKDTPAEMPWVIMSKANAPECKTSDDLWRKRYWSDLPTACTTRTKTTSGCVASALIKKYKDTGTFLGIEGGVSEAD